MPASTPSPRPDDLGQPHEHTCYEGPERADGDAGHRWPCRATPCALGGEAICDGHRESAAANGPTVEDVFGPDAAGDLDDEEAERTARERRRAEALYRQAQRVYDEEDRSPDSFDEPERPVF